MLNVTACLDWFDRIPLLVLLLEMEIMALIRTCFQPLLGPPTYMESGSRISKILPDSPVWMSSTRRRDEMAMAVGK